MRDFRRNIVSVVERGIGHMPHYLVQKNPFFGDLLNQPEFLVVPELGRLLAVYVYTPTRNLTWRSVLAMAEDVFEAKLATGESTVVAALLAGKFIQAETDPIYLEFLSGFFDLFRILDGDDKRAAASFASSLVSAEPRSDLFQLWRLERQRVLRNAVRFEEDKYLEIADGRVRPTKTKATLIREAKEILRRETGVEVIENFRVSSPKEALAGLPERNVFIFDLGVVASTIAPRRIGIDAAVFDRYGSRAKLRYFMTKARFTSYEFLGSNLVYRNNDTTPVLVIDGNISGPSHDPYRYAKSLVSTGWHITRTHMLEFQKLIRADV